MESLSGGGGEGAGSGGVSDKKRKNEPDGSARKERMNKRAKAGELADIVDAGENLSHWNQNYQIDICCGSFLFCVE